MTERETIMKNNAWLNEKTVVVTGASSGMGKGIATRLIKERNCRVIGVARSEKKMKEFVEELGADARQFSYQLFDVSKYENWENFAKYLDENEIQVDVLVNNAGILPAFKRFDRYTLEEVESVMAINFFSCVYSVHVMLPRLLKYGNEPAIINIDSSAALMALAGTTTYSASKAALKSFTEALREELRGKCYVGLVCPGFTKTDIFRNQQAAGGEKAFELISTACDKMVRMIMNGVTKQKGLMVYGKDAKAMEIFGRLMPVKGTQLFSNVMKWSKLPLFDAVFKD